MVDIMAMADVMGMTDVSVEELDDTFTNFLTDIIVEKNGGDVDGDVDDDMRKLTSKILDVFDDKKKKDELISFFLSRVKADIKARIQADILEDHVLKHDIPADILKADIGEFLKADIKAHKDFKEFVKSWTADI